MMRRVAPIFAAVFEIVESGTGRAKLVPSPICWCKMVSGCEYEVIWAMICVEGLSSSRRFGSSLSSSVSRSA